MSSSNAAAIRRRVGNQVSAPPEPPQTGRPAIVLDSDQSTKTSGMTLQEVITHFNKRITSLEENKQPVNIATTDELNPIIQEFNDRFELFATEIAMMKDQLLKLQTYTMDVNKMLLEERVQVLSTNISSTNISSTNTDPIEQTSMVNEDIDAQTINTDLISELQKDMTTSVDMSKELDNFNHDE